MTIIWDQGGSSTGVYTVIRSWKHHSTGGILELFSSGTDLQGVGTRSGSSGTAEDKQDELKETLTNTKVKV